MGQHDALGASALGPAACALPFLTALCWTADKRGQRRHKTSVDWVQQMMKQDRRWVPERALVLVVDGSFAAVSLALTRVNHHITMVLRLRSDAVLYHRPGSRPPASTVPNPRRGSAHCSKPTWSNIHVLLLGTLLARGRRTVTAAFRQMDLHEASNFSLYHHMLNRAC